jgi:hypothetical protein
MPIARYDDMATYSVFTGTVSGFISANQKSASDWAYPEAAELLKAITDWMLSHPVVETGPFRRLLELKHARLVVGLVGPIDGPASVMQVVNPASAFVGEEVPYRRVQFILRSGGNDDDAGLNITDERWIIGRRKCSLPNHRWVTGPYLVIAAVDNASNLTLRARLFPVWISSDKRTFAIVRSDYERVAMAAIHANGGVAFTPIHRAQLAQLQTAFCHRWQGDLTTYPFLPDIIPMPSRGHLVSVLEIFGLRKFKKYEEGRLKKQTEISHMLKKQFKFLCISQSLMKSSGSAHLFMRNLIERWYLCRPQFLWKCW